MFDMAAPDQKRSFWPTFLASSSIPVTALQQAAFSNLWGCQTLLHPHQNPTLQLQSHHHHLLPPTPTVHGQRPCFQNHLWNP